MGLLIASFLAQCESTDSNIGTEIGFRLCDCPLDGRGVHVQDGKFHQGRRLATYQRTRQVWRQCTQADVYLYGSRQAPDCQQASHAFQNLHAFRIRTGNQLCTSQGLRLRGGGTQDFAGEAKSCRPQGPDVISPYSVNDLRYASCDSTQLSVQECEHIAKVKSADRKKLE